MINTNILRIIEYHKENNYDLTLIATQKQFVLPYGTCNIKKDGTLLKIKEKPKLDYLINAGLYVINTNTIKLIPKNKKYDITDFISKLNLKGYNIGVYVIDQNKWIDFGELNEYNKSIERI